MKKSITLRLDIEDIEEVKEGVSEGETLTSRISSLVKKGLLYEKERNINSEKSVKIKDDYYKLLKRAENLLKYWEKTEIEYKR